MTRPTQTWSASRTSTSEMEDWKLAGTGKEPTELTALPDSLAIGIAGLAIPDTSTAGPE